MDLQKLNEDRYEMDKIISKLKEDNDNLKLQEDMLTNKLQIVEKLKDLLEKQIGKDNVDEFMNYFTNEARQSVAVILFFTTIFIIKI